jgi:hypothetical protein
VAEGVTPRTYAVVACAAFIAFGVLFGWTAEASLVVAPLLTGVFVGLCLHSPFASSLVAGGAGLLSGLVSAAVYAMPGLYERATASPPHTNSDIPTLLYQIVGTMMMRNPLNSLPQPTGLVLLLLCSSMGTAAAAWGCAMLLQVYRGDRNRLRRMVATGLVAVLCTSYMLTAVSASSEMLSYASQDPPAGTYAFDATVYLKTYYNMLRGEDYYTALLSAAAGDSRVMADTTTGIRDGKSYGGWLWGPAAMRRPAIFYVWRYLAPGGGAGIIYLAVALGAITLAAVFWGLMPYLSYRAAFVATFVMPYVLFMTLSLNPFFPDFWAALLATCALALIMRRQWIAAAVTFLVAAAIRETLGPGLAVVSASLLVVWLRHGRGREWLARAGVFAGGTVLWLGLERLHEIAGARFMAVAYRSSLDILLETMQTRSFAVKVVRATQYLVFPYGFYYIPGGGTFVFAPLGFWAVLASRKDVRAVVLAYTLFWIAFVFIVGATSSYWGQVIMLPSLVGLGGLLMSADRMNRRFEMLEPIA